MVQGHVLVDRSRQDSEISIEEEDDEEEEEVESEEEADGGSVVNLTAAVDRLEDETDPPLARNGETSKKGKHATEPASGEDANSRRWLEILGKN